MSFWTNAKACTVKWYKFTDQNYIAHIERLTLSHEAAYRALRKNVAVLRFQPMVIRDELYKEFAAVQPYIANSKQMAIFKVMGVGKCGWKFELHQEVSQPVMVINFVINDVSSSKQWVCGENLCSYDVMLASGAKRLWWRHCQGWT
jgi:hypothetical protein